MRNRCRGQAKGDSLCALRYSLGPDATATSYHPPFTPGRTRFESEMQVRPDDLDMTPCPREQVPGLRPRRALRPDGALLRDGDGGVLFELGLNWFTRTSHVEYKRPLKLGERFVVRTWIQEFAKDGVRVEFEILKRDTGKLAADGWGHFTLVSVKTGRAVPLPPEIVAKYAV